MEYVIAQKVFFDKNVCILWIMWSGENGSNVNDLWKAETTDIKDNVVPCPL